MVLVDTNSIIHDVNNITNINHFKTNVTRINILICMHGIKRTALNLQIILRSGMDNAHPP